MALPDFVIIGAQKAGSTALMKHLGDHPQVFLPRGETRYFRDPWFQFQTEADLAADLRGAGPDVLARGIKCPNLLGDAHCAQRVLDVLGSVPLIAVLRDPVQRAVSAYFWLMQWGFLPLAQPSEGLTRILDGDYEDDYPAARNILDYGLYAQHVARYQGLFGADRLLVMTDEDLRTGTDSALRRVFRHLGVRDDVPLARNERRVNTGVYSMRRLQVLQHRHKYIRRPYAGYEEFGEFMQPASGMHDRIMNRAIAAWDRLVLAKVLPNDKPAVSAEVLGRLAAYYADDLAALSQVTDIDTTGWRARHVTGSHER